MLAFKILIAVLVGYAILRTGLAVLRMFATPLPEPPPAGEMRKVKMNYRCDICGTEVQMKVATSADPEAPRHCLDDMRLVSSIDD
jgi:hypothetical protein